MKRQQISLRLPKAIVRQAELVARELGVSYSGYVNLVLIKWVPKLFKMNMLKLPPIKGLLDSRTAVYLCDEALRHVERLVDYGFNWSFIAQQALLMEIRHGDKNDLRRFKKWLKE